MTGGIRLERLDAGSVKAVLDRARSLRPRGRGPQDAVEELLPALESLRTAPASPVNEAAPDEAAPPPPEGQTIEGYRLTADGEVDVFCSQGRGADAPMLQASWEDGKLVEATIGLGADEAISVVETENGLVALGVDPAGVPVAEGPGHAAALAAQDRRMARMRTGLPPGHREGRPSPPVSPDVAGIPEVAGRWRRVTALAGGSAALTRAARWLASLDDFADEPGEDEEPDGGAGEEASDGGTRGEARDEAARGEAAPSRARTSRRCPQCGTLLEGDPKFCHECGSRVGDTTCSACGARARPGLRFCTSCGARREDE